MRARFLTELQYADDLVILGHSAEDEIQIMLNVFMETYDGLGMEVNQAKNKLLVMRI